MNKMMLFAIAALFSAGIACAALTAKDLTPAAVRDAVAALPAKQRQDYARQIIEAISASPEDEATKTQTLTSAARALIAGARTGGAVGIIAEIYNSVPVANLQGVANLLAANNFGQTLNGMTDEQFDKFAATLVKSASQYIMASGTDSPTLRISILVATFTKASADAERTREKLLAALPASMQAAARTYVTASEQNNASVIAAAAGVDAVEATPADPDAGNVVQPRVIAEDPATPEAEEAYLTPKAADQPESEKPEGENDGDAKVPLIARMSSDVLGFTIDAMHMTIYSWDTIEPTARVADPVIGTMPGLSSTFEMPGNAAPTMPFLPPSPAYGNQRTN